MYHSIKEIIDICDEENKEFWQVVLESDVQERGVTETMSMESMSKLYEAMKLADADYKPELKSASGLAGGDGQKYTNTTRLAEIFAEIS